MLNSCVALLQVFILCSNVNGKLHGLRRKYLSALKILLPSLKYLSVKLFSCIKLYWLPLTDIWTQTVLFLPTINLDKCASYIIQRHFSPLCWFVPFYTPFFLDTCGGSVPHKSPGISPTISKNNCDLFHLIKSPTWLHFTFTEVWRTSCPFSLASVVTLAFVI